MKSHSFSKKEESAINEIANEELEHAMHDMRSITINSLKRMTNRCEIENTPESWVISTFMLRFACSVLSMVIHPIIECKENKNLLIHEIREHIKRIENE